MQQSPTERIAVVDVLRAVALCGIAVTHAEMGFLAGPPPADFMVFSNLDATVSRWIGILVESKFFTIFSFLFGLSFAIQIDSAREKNRPFAGRFAWRLTLLFLIGMAHQLLFNGDILMIYAALGFLLLPLSRLRSGVLLVVALLLVLNVPGLVQDLRRIHSPPSAAEQQRDNENMARVYGVGGKRLYEANKHGTLGELARVNYYEGLEMKWVYQSSTGRLWITFGCFLLGLAAGRAQLFRDTEGHRRFFRGLLLVGGAIALLSTALPMFYTADSAVAGAWMSFASSAQKATLAAFYVAAVTLAFWAAPRGWLASLAPLGKMGLTIYLLQSLVLAVICCGFGFGLMGEFGSAAAVLIGLGLFLVQVFLARAWMSRYSMGPVEWLWRTATWLEPQPLARPAPA
jgi:uncharacterized protein